MRGLIGDAEVYDVGTKVTITLHADKLSESPQKNALMRTIYEAALKNRLWAEDEPDRPDLVYGPGYVDASRRSKGSGVRVLFDSRPILRALKARPAGMPQDAVVKIVVGDSRNDLTTMIDEELLPGSRNLNVFVNRLPEYAEALPETAVVARRDHVEGTIDLFGWLERAAPERPNEEILIPFPAEKWLRLLDQVPGDARVDGRAERLLAQNISNRAPFELAEWFGRCIDDLHQRLGIDTYSSLLIVTRRIQEALIHREIAPGDLYRSFIWDGGLYVYVPRVQVEFEDLRASHHYWDVFNVPSEKIVARHLRLNRSMLFRQHGMPEIVVIAGAAGSGKTVFAGKLDAELRNQGGTAMRISIDDFLLPRNERRAKKLRGVDAFDRQRLDRVIDAVREGGVTTLPKYVPEDGSIQETEPVDFAKYDTVILEGAFPLSFQSIRSAADLKVFIYENAQTQYDSRRARDPKERGYRPVDIAYSFAEVGVKETLPLVSRDIPVFDWIIHESRDERGSAGSGTTQPYRILWRSEPNDPSSAAADLRRDALSGARMADGPAEALPVAEKYILNSRGETMKEAVARLRTANRPDLASDMDLDPMQWTFFPDHGGRAERERLSKLTLEALGEEIKSKIRSGVMANWSGLDLTEPGRVFLKSFIDMQSGSLESMEHHLNTSRAYDQWADRDGAIKRVLALKPEKMVEGEMYKALLQEIAARWAMPEGRGESSEILFDFDARYEPDLELYMRARHGKKIETLTAGEPLRDVASAVVMGAYALNYAAKVMESGGDVAAVTITPDPEAESGVVRATVTSSDWLQRHALNNLAQHLSALTRPPDGFSREGYGADALQNLREHLLSHNRQAERSSDRYATYREFFDRAVKQLKSSHDALELLMDAEPHAAALNRYPKEVAEMGSDDRPRQVELAVVPTQALGYYLLSKAFVGREDRLPSFRSALRRFLELEPIIIDELQKISELPGLAASLPQPSSLEGSAPESAAARMAAPAEEAVIRSIFGDEPIRRDLAAMGVDDNWMATTPFYEPGEVSFGFGRRSLGQGFDHRPKVSPMTEQGRILKEDLGQLIRLRAAADNRRLFLVQVGLGDLANETSDLLELIGEAFRSAQTDPGGWSIDLALMDMDGAILQNARQKFGDSVGGIRMHYETVNVCDTDAMRAYSQKLNTIAPSGADYYLARNMLYENTTAAAMRNFDLPAPGYFDAWRGRVGGAEVYGFNQLISITLGLKNAMRFFGRPASGQEPGTRYLIDPIEYFGSRPRVAFVPNGMRSVSPPMLGVLELVDPQAVAALGLYSSQSGFKEVGETGARMADEKRSVLAPVGELDGSVVDILRQHENGRVLSDAEVQSLMRYVVVDARKSIFDRTKDRYADEDDLQALLSPTQAAGKCAVAQDRAVGIFKYVPSVRCAKHYTDNLFDADVRHAFTIAGTEGGPAYWVDPTFNQFFDPSLSGLWDVGRRFREKEKEMGTDFEARLIRDGFLPYDERLVELYAYAFAEDRALGEEAEIARNIVKYGRIWEDSIYADRCIHRREFKARDLTDPDKSILRAAAARILAAQTARPQGTEQLRLPVGLKRGFAVLGVQTLPLGIRLMVGDFVLAEWTSEHEIEAASRSIDPASDAEKQVDRIVTSTQAFENDLIGAARKVGEQTQASVTQWTQIQTAQLISSDPRSRSGEIKLLLSTLKYLTAQKPFNQDRYYLASEGLDPGEIKFIELFIKRTGMEGALEVGEMPDATLQQNPSVVPVIWCGEEAGQKTGWVNVLFAKAGEGLQPYGKAKYVSTMAILGSVRNAASASLWDDYKAATSFDQEVFEAVHEQYSADAGFASASDYLDSIRNTNNRTLKLGQALPLYPFRVGARLSELQKTLQQTETMA